MECTPYPFKVAEQVRFSFVGARLACHTGLAPQIHGLKSELWGLGGTLRGKGKLVCQGTCRDPQKRQQRYPEVILLSSLKKMLSHNAS